MALLHRAELHPTKLELLATWLPGRDWYQEDTAAGVARVASYRFDDPAGAVGIETMLVQARGGPVYQVPLTYRGAPLEGADGRLIGTAEHSVLGPRWVYDACGDPVYVSALAGAILAATGQAEEFFEIDGRRELREPSMTLTVTGSAGQGAAVPAVDARFQVVDDDPTRIVTDPVELVVARRLDDRTVAAGAILSGTWNGQPTPLCLAHATPR